MPPGQYLSENPGLARACRSFRGPREVEIYPSVKSLTKTYLTSLVLLRQELEPFAAPLRMAHGFRDISGKNGAMAPSYAQVQTCTIQMTPEGGPSGDNAEATPSPNMSPHQEAVVHYMFMELYDHGRFQVPFGIRKGTSTGPLRFTKISEEKLAGVRDAVKALPLMRQLADAIIKGSSSAANDALLELSKLGIGFLSKDGRRYQQDSAVMVGGRVVPKNRSAIDYKGRYYKQVDHTQTLFGIEFASARSRLVYNQPGEVNWLCQSAWAPIREASLDHHHDAFIELDSEQQSRLEDNYPYSASCDVKECDHSAPAWLLLEFLRGACTIGYPSVLAWATVLMYFAPMVVTNDHLGGKGAICFGNFLDIGQYSVMPGNRSGIWNNGDVNKLGVNSDMVLRFMTVGLLPRDVRSAIREYSLMLQHSHPRVAIQNRGDNVRILTKDAGFLARYRAALEHPPVPNQHMYKFDFDAYVKFDGWDYCLLGGKRIRQPNKEAALAKFTMPEWNWSALTAPNIGSMERIRRLRTAYGGEIILDKLQRHMARCGVKDFMGEVERGERKEMNELATRALTAIDKAVLDDPSKIGWKYKLEEVSPHVREAVLIRPNPGEDQQWLRAADKASVNLPMPQTALLL